MKNISDNIVLFGTEKSTCYDQPISILTPDQFISQDYFYQMLFGKNALSQFRQKDVNGSVKKTVAYTYTSGDMVIHLQ